MYVIEFCSVKFWEKEIRRPIMAAAPSHAKPTCLLTSRSQTSATLFQSQNRLAAVAPRASMRGISKHAVAWHLYVLIY